MNGLALEVEDLQVRYGGIQAGRGITLSGPSGRDRAPRSVPVRELSPIPGSSASGVIWWAVFSPRKSCGGGSR